MCYYQEVVSLTNKLVADIFDCFGVVGPADMVAMVTDDRST